MRIHCLFFIFIERKGCSRFGIDGQEVVCSFWCGYWWFCLGLVSFPGELWESVYYVVVVESLFGGMEFCDGVVCSAAFLLERA